MTLMEHLGELRTRIIIVFCAVAAGAVIGWFLYPPVFTFMQKPFCAIIHDHPELALKPGSCQFVFQTPVEPFFIKLKIVTFIGLGIALPIVLWQLWRFVTPGLQGRERRYAIPFVIASILLFGLGAAFGIYTLPKALNFLLGFAGPGLVATLSVSKYMSFVFFMIAAFGLSFEFPVVLTALVMAGVLNSQKLREMAPRRDRRDRGVRGRDHADAGLVHDDADDGAPDNLLRDLDPDRPVRAEEMSRPGCRKV